MLAMSRTGMVTARFAVTLVGCGSCQAMAEGVLGPPVSAGRLDLLSLT